MNTLLKIDGSAGEGGGQILRTALGLSLVTGKPFRIERIRAGREKPGLMRQHLTAVLAAAQVGAAEVEGAAIGSQVLTFHPAPVTPGAYHFATGSAGSVTLVLQTVLPALMLADQPSSLVLEGGTHNPLAPPFDFLQKAFLPLLEKIGPRVRIELERPGFYPAGGGWMRVEIEPAAQLNRVSLPSRGALRSQRARAIVAALDRSIGVRELAAVQQAMQWDPADLHIEHIPRAHGPGNVLLLEIESEHVTEVISSFGMRNISSEQVAHRAAQEALQYLQSGAAIGPHLADQLLIPMALAGGGHFTTLEPTPHTLTNAAVIEQFLGIATTVRPLEAGVWEVKVGST